MGEMERLAQIEKEIDELYRSQRSLEESLHKLTITLALLDQTLKSVKLDQENKAAFAQRVVFFGIGGMISAVVAFIVKGGLAI